MDKCKEVKHNGRKFYIVESRGVRFDSSLTAEQRSEIEQFLVNDIPCRISTEYIAYYDDDILETESDYMSPAVMEFLAGLIEKNGGNVNIQLGF